MSDRRADETPVAAEKPVGRTQASRSNFTSSHHDDGADVVLAVDGVMPVYLDDPGRANALSDDMLRGLDTAMRSAQEGGGRVVVLQGRGRNFCAGFDLSSTDESSADVTARFVRIEQLLHRVRMFPCMTVAVVHGAAIGAGADLAVACDYRFGLVDSKLSFRFPGFQFGAALGTRWLVERVGRETARDLLLSGRSISAEEAHDCGLLTHVGTRAELERLVGDLSSAADLLTADALDRLLRLTRPQASPSDLAELVESVSRDDIADAVHGYAARRRK